MCLDEWPAQQGRAAVVRRARAGGSKPADLDTNGRYFQVTLKLKVNVASPSALTGTSNCAVLASFIV